jgi:hypothetical protein
VLHQRGPAVGSWVFYGEGPRSRCYGCTAALRLIVQPCDEDDSFFFPFFEVMEHRWNEIERGKPKYSGKNLSQVPLCPPQISQGLTRDRTRASAVRGRRLTEEVGYCKSSDKDDSYDNILVLKYVIQYNGQPRSRCLFLK